ncbi:chemotaxis protein CheW [Anaerovorax odorimutans]|uniref:Chemotaxis protein CheW n=1 Tax=Anaerovorax odorimutans TaxID=109327 RepID=A0ABT1RP09_9FIRM|nr:chemotaxis protein CheW [Anaerovorax odorimutans]MCQ4636933.1 chemotaxis protein CheW [Anaerovorax odorimutans]
MTSNNKNELLLLSGEEKNYAVEFSYVTEICFDLPISRIPALPDGFLGMSNYKGNIVPIIELKNGGAAIQPVILIMQHLKYQFGLRAEAQLNIIPAGAAAIVQESGSSGEDDADLWREKGLYRYEGKLISLLDVERSIEGILLL